MEQEEHRFAKDYAFFKNIPLNQRAAYNREILERPQSKGEYKIHRIQFPTMGNWTYNGHKLNCYSYKHDELKEPKALLFSFHGLNAHSGSSGYTLINIAKSLQLDAYALDFMNFGRSEGPFRGEIQSLQSLVLQAQNFISYILSQYSNKSEIKVYISGLSLGGAVCFKLCLRNPSKYAGAIFLSPAFRENAEAQPILKKIGKIFGALFPRTKLLSQTFNSQSRIDQTERIMADPYIYKDKVVPGSIKIVLDSMQNISKEFKNFENPFILIQSGVDKMVDPFAALDFEQECKSKDKTVIYCKDMWHAVYGEQEIQYIVPIITQWLRERL